MYWKACFVDSCLVYQFLFPASIWLSSNVIVVLYSYRGGFFMMTLCNMRFTLYLITQSYIINYCCAQLPFYVHGKSSRVFFPGNLPRHNWTSLYSVLFIKKKLILIFCSQFPFRCKEGIRFHARFIKSNLVNPSERKQTTFPPKDNRIQIKS